MGESEIFEVLRASLWAGVLMGLPILGVSLVLGFAIGLVQALTSVQEMTLTFVPKIIAVVAVFFLTIGYMTRVCIDLFNNFIIPMITL
mgnify:FL=1